MVSVKKTIMRFVAVKLFSSATVSKTEAVSEHFRVIEIESDVLLKTHVRPGDKIGVLVGSEKRCYTPIPSGSGGSSLRLAVYLHGRGPGSDWAATVKASDVCRFAGPRPSLDLSAVCSPCVLFGDETSFAIASVLQNHLGDSHASRLVFEVNSIQESRDVAAALGLRDMSLIEKKDDNSHLGDVGIRIKEELRSIGAQHLALTGCGPSIQTARRELDRIELGYAKNLVKVYWAPGKVALD